MRPGKTATIHFFSQILVSVAGFVATLFIARELGAAVVGAYAVVVGLLSWINIPGASIGNAVTKRMSEGTNQAAFASAGIAMNLGIGFVLAILVLVLERWINQYVGQSVATLLAALVIGDYAFKTILPLLEGKKQVGRAGLLSALERISRTVAQIVLAVLGYGLFGLLTGHTLSLVAAAVIGVLISAVPLVRPRTEHVKSLLAYVRYAWLGTIDNRVFAWIDTLILALFVTDVLIGIYEVAWTLAAVFTLISHSVSTTLFPELSELSEQDDYKEIRHFVNESLAFVGIFSIPGLVGAVLLGERVLVLYGQTFARGAEVLVLLVATQLVGSYAGQFRNTLNALDRPDLTFRINLAFIVANIGLNVILIWWIGWTGAAMASLLSTSLSLALGYVAIGNLLEYVPLPVGVLGAEIGGSIIMAIGVVGLEGATPRTTATTFLLVFFGAGVYTLSVVALSGRIRTKIRTIILSRLSN